MPDNYMSCPSCSAAIKYKPEWVGRRGKCLNCSTVITFGEPDPAEIASRMQLAPSPDDPQPARDTSRPRTTRAPASLSRTPSPRAAVRDHTPFESLGIRTGVTMIIMGVLAPVLPFVGLTWRGFDKVDPMVAGAALFIGGCAISAFFAFKRHLSLKVVLIGAAAMVLLFIGLIAAMVALAIGVEWQRDREFARIQEEAAQYRRDATPPAFASPAGVNTPAVAPTRSSGPTRTSAPRRSPAPAQPPQPAEPDPAVLARMQNARSAGELATLTLRNCTQRQADQVQREVTFATKATAHRRVEENGDYTLVLFPVREMKPILMAISDGNIVQLDEAAKTLVLDF